MIIHLTPEKYPWWIEHEPGKKIIGYTVWETDKIKPFWVGALNLLDGLMVPCEWNKKIFEEGGVTIPIDVVPHLLDQRIVSLPAVSDTEIKGPEKEYVFYSINSWIDRKAIPQLIKAYLDAFSADDPTCLIIKTTPLDESKSIRPHFLERILFRTHFMLLKLKWGYKSPARIKLITKRLNEREIIDLHMKGDCYVSLTRAEGWGLGAYDAATAGNPVIITGFGGQLDYLPEDLAYLVNFDLVQVRFHWRGEDFNPFQRWAETHVAHASQLMRHVFENQAKAVEKGTALKKYVLENFSEKMIMEKFLLAITRKSQDEKTLSALS